MKLRFEDHGPLCVVQVEGELVGESSDSLRRACRERLEQSARGEQPRHRGRLTAGHPQRGDSAEIIRGANLLRGMPEIVEQRLM